MLILLGSVVKFLRAMKNADDTIVTQIDTPLSEFKTTMNSRLDTLRNDMTNSMDGVIQSALRAKQGDAGVDPQTPQEIIVTAPTITPVSWTKIIGLVPAPGVPVQLLDCKISITLGNTASVPGSNYVGYISMQRDTFTPASRATLSSINAIEYKPIEGRNYNAVPAVVSLSAGAVFRTIGTAGTTPPLNQYYEGVQITDEYWIGRHGVGQSGLAFWAYMVAGTTITQIRLRYICGSALANTGEV